MIELTERYRSGKNRKFSIDHTFIDSFSPDMIPFASEEKPRTIVITKDRAVHYVYEEYSEIKAMIGKDLAESGMSARLNNRINELAKENDELRARLREAEDAKTESE